MMRLLLKTLCHMIYFFLRTTHETFLELFIVGKLSMSWTTQSTSSPSFSREDEWVLGAVIILLHGSSYSWITMYQRQACSHTFDKDQMLQARKIKMNDSKGRAKLVLVSTLVLLCHIHDCSIYFFAFVMLWNALCNLKAWKLAFRACNRTPLKLFVKDNLKLDLVPSWWARLNTCKHNAQIQSF